MTNKMLGVAKGVYPVDTGKVLIGRSYIPKHTHYTTEAEFWVQNLLLRKPRSPSGVSCFRKRLQSVVNALSFWRV